MIIELYFGLCLSLLYLFIILDGTDFGVGMIQLFYAKTPEEKKILSKAAGYHFDFHEVWLIVFGGMLFFGFPKLYALLFSAFYLPIMILLWLLIMRSLGLKLRHYISHPIWQKLWDAFFGVSSLLLSFFTGIGFGNFIRGFMLDGQPHDEMFLPLWTEDFFAFGHHPGIIDAFTITTGIAAVLMFMIQGIHGLRIKTDLPLVNRLLKLRDYLVYALLLIAIVLITITIQLKPEHTQTFREQAWLMLLPTFFISALLAPVFFKNKLPSWSAWFSSSLAIMAAMSLPFLLNYPKILPPYPQNSASLNINEVAGNVKGLENALPWIILALIVGALCLYFFYRLMVKKVEDAE